MAITVYGADWCPLTTRSRKFLDSKEVSYSYIDIDEDREAAKWVASHNDGKEKKPTIDIAGVIVVEPSNAELEKALEKQGLL